MAGQAPAAPQQYVSFEERQAKFFKKELVQDVSVPKRISHVQFALMTADEVSDMETLCTKQIV